MKRVHLISARMMLLVLIACVSSSAQPGQSLSAKSYQEARRVVDAGLQALGDIETLQRIDDVSLKYTAKGFQQGQRANPDASYDVADEEGTRVIDLRGGRSYREQKVSFRGFSGYWGRLVVKNKEAFIHDVASNVVDPFAVRRK